MKGERQAKQMAAWLNQRLDKRAIVLVSPALRAVQTANALGLEYEIEHEIRPGADIETILGVISRYLDENDQQPKRIILVGHQPWIGQAIGRMLGMREGVEVKKGAVWWLHSDTDASSPQFRLLASMCPQML